MNRTPLYKQTFAYAQEHGETAKYNASLQANIACKEAIEAAIRDNYHDYCLDAAGRWRRSLPAHGFSTCWRTPCNP